MTCVLNSSCGDNHISEDDAEDIFKDVGEKLKTH